MAARNVDKRSQGEWTAWVAAWHSPVRALPCWYPGWRVCVGSESCNNRRGLGAEQFNAIPFLSLLVGVSNVDGQSESRSTKDIQ